MVSESRYVPQKSNKREMVFPPGISSSSGTRKQVEFSPLSRADLIALESRYVSKNSNKYRREMVFPPGISSSSGTHKQVEFSPLSRADLIAFESRYVSQNSNKRKMVFPPGISSSSGTRKQVEVIDIDDEDDDDNVLIWTGVTGKDALNGASKIWVEYSPLQKDSTITSSRQPFVSSRPSGGSFVHNPLYGKKIRSSPVAVQPPVASASTTKNVDEIRQKFNDFKNFDIVEDFSDHHYCWLSGDANQPPKDVFKRIWEEWKILEKNLHAF